MLGIPTMVVGISQNLNYGAFNNEFAQVFRGKTGREPTTVELYQAQWNWTQQGIADAVARAEEAQVEDSE